MIKYNVVDLIFDELFYASYPPLYSLILLFFWKQVLLWLSACISPLVESSLTLCPVFLCGCVPMPSPPAPCP